ncbi:hypothetical protein D3C85_1541320 [compost metagenome]
MATPLTCGFDPGKRVSAGKGMISLTLSRLIAMSLPLRKVNSSSESESARAFWEAMVNLLGGPLRRRYAGLSTFRGPALALARD